MSNENREKIPGSRAENAKPGNMVGADFTQLLSATEGLLDEEADLWPVSAGLLHEGFEVLEDIYAEDAETILFMAGETLEQKQIDIFRRNYIGRDSIMVSSGTHRELMGAYISARIPDKAELEASTGYGKMAEEALHLFRMTELTGKLAAETVGKLMDMLKTCILKADEKDIFDLLHAPSPGREFLPRHLLNTALLNALIGRWMKLEASEIEQLILVGLLHDCGMALIPEALLMAPRKLTYCEYEVIKMHSVYSFELLAGYPDPVKYGVRDHHERLDSSGYPDGVGGGSISFAARITAVSDVYTACVANRNWRRGSSPFHVMAHLVAFSGTKFDPYIVEVFTKNMLRLIVGKPVSLTDGEVGTVHEVNIGDIVNPTIKTGGRSSKVISMDSDLSCEGICFTKASYPKGRGNKE